MTGDGSRRAGALRGVARLVALAATVTMAAAGCTPASSMNACDRAAKEAGEFYDTSPWRYCDGACTDLGVDANHCGACGHACSAGTVCCAGTCRNLQSDPAGCGACGTRCPQNGTCTAGVCGCPADLADLCTLGSGTEVCTDLATAGNRGPQTLGYCGTCGRICSFDLTARCVGGACVCAPNQTDCGGDRPCRDLQTDTGSCGSCGFSCGPGAYCAGGTCGCYDGFSYCGSSLGCVRGTCPP